MSNPLTTFDFNFSFILTIILINVKLFLALYILLKMLERKKETGQFPSGFILGIFIFVISMLVSRILFFYFDFYLTKLDPNEFYKMPAILVWKIAMLITTFGATIFLYITDRSIMDFKFKGLLAYLLLILGIIQFFYPVNSSEDFQIVSIFELRFLILIIIIPSYFLYLAWKPSIQRFPCICLALGIIFYGFGAFLQSEPVIILVIGIFGNTIRIPMYLLSLISKSVGLFLTVQGVILFTIRISK